jgi:excisionase family DNA binding protein
MEDALGRLLTSREVAALLAVSRSWVYEAAKAGRIPSIRIGDRDGPLRFAQEDIEDWLGHARSAWEPGRPPPATAGRTCSAVKP